MWERESIPDATRRPSNSTNYREATRTKTRSQQCAHSDMHMIELCLIAASLS
jgi:hypothetical protein